MNDRADEGQLIGKPYKYAQILNVPITRIIGNCELARQFSGFSCLLVSCLGIGWPIHHHVSNEPTDLTRFPFQT